MHSNIYLKLKQQTADCRPSIKVQGLQIRNQGAKCRLITGSPCFAVKSIPSSTLFVCGTEKGRLMLADHSRVMSSADSGAD